MLSERKSILEPWPVGKSVEELNVLGNKLQDPSLTEGELIIVFNGVDIPGGKGDCDLWMATRPDRHTSFTNYRNLSEINTEFGEFAPFISPDGFELYFCSDRNGQKQLFKASRDNLDEEFRNIQPLTQFDITGINNAQPCLSYNGHEMYFMKAKVSDRSTRDIYVSYFSGNSSSFMNKLSKDTYYGIDERDNEK